MQAADRSALGRDLAVLLSLFLVVAGSAAPIIKVGAQPEDTSQLTVVAKDTEGHDLVGKHAELRYNDSVFDSGFIPHTFTVTNSQQYQLGIADYSRYAFDHWSDSGSTDRWRTVTITGDTTLVAIYRVILDNSPAAGQPQAGSTSSSGGGGGGGQKPAVIILSPENGEPVNPRSFGVYGITIGNPTSVEIAVANPNTGGTGPYHSVTPISPSDFSRWSYSLSVSDLTMTQVKVKATFPNGGVQEDTVEVYYYVPGGSGTSATNSLAANESTGHSISTPTSAGAHKTISLYSSIQIADKSDNPTVTSSPAAVDSPKAPDKSPAIANIPSGTETSDSASGGGPSYLLILVILVLAASAGIALLSLRRRIAAR